MGVCVCVKQTTVVVRVKDSQPDKCTVKAPRLRIHWVMHMHSHGSFRIITALKNSGWSQVWRYTVQCQWNSFNPNRQTMTSFPGYTNPLNAIICTKCEDFHQKYLNQKCVHAVVTGWWGDKYKQPLISPFTAKHEDLSQAKSSIEMAFNNKSLQQEGSTLQ